MKIKKKSTEILWIFNFSDLKQGENLIEGKFLGSWKILEFFPRRD